MYRKYVCVFHVYFSDNQNILMYAVTHNTYLLKRFSDKNNVFRLEIKKFKMKKNFSVNLYIHKRIVEYSIQFDDNICKIIFTITTQGTYVFYNIFVTQH